MRILKTRKSKIIAVILLFIIGFLVWFFFPERDIDESDLMPQFINVPDAENGFLHVNFKLGDIYYPSNPLRGEIYRKITEGTTWDKDVAQEVVDKNKVLFKLISKAIKSGSFKMPECKDVSTMLPYVSAWHELSRINKIMTKLLLEEGKKTEAIESAMEMIEFGHIVMNSANCYVSFLTGNSILTRACYSFMEAMKDKALTREEIFHYIDKFYQVEISREIEADISKREYLIFANTFDNIAEGTFKYETLWGTSTTYSRLEFRIFFNPRSTKKLFVEMFRITVKNCYKPYAEKESLDPLIKKWSGVHWFTSNSIGKKFTADNARSNRGIEEEMNINRLLCRLMSVMVALKCYKLDNGDLPISLEQLVPGYIKNIPLDPFDDKPIRYSKEKKMVYSIGADLIESGGASEEEIIQYKSSSSRLLRAKDPTIMIEF